MEMNWIALIVAALATFMLGWVWYGMIFKNAWQAETGITDEKAKAAGGMVLTMVLSVVLAFFVAFFLAAFCWIHAQIPEEVAGQAMEYTFKHGAFHGAFIAIVVGLPILITNARYELRSWKLIAINAGYWIISFAIMGGIVFAWQ